MYPESINSFKNLNIRNSLFFFLPLLKSRDNKLSFHNCFFINKQNFTISANQNDLINTVCLLDSSVTVIGVVPSGESKRLRLFYVVILMINIFSYC